MDKMAYLQQIATNGSKSKQNQETGIGRFLTLKNGIILLVVTVLFVVACMIFGMLNKGENKGQKLAAQSYWRSTYIVKTLDKYVKNVKSSDLRAIYSSLNGVLREIILDHENLLVNNFDTEKVKDLEGKDYVVEISEDNDRLTNNLEVARISGTLDRTFVREVSYQVSILISYESECVERAKSDDVKNVCQKSEDNLNNILNRLNHFSDPSS